MQIKALWHLAGRSAMILVAGLCVSLASPSAVTKAHAQDAATAQAAPEKPMALRDFTKHAKPKKSARTSRKARRQEARAQERKAEESKAAEAKAADAKAADVKAADAKTADAKAEQAKSDKTAIGDNTPLRGSTLPGIANANARMLAPGDTSNGQTPTLLKADDLLKKMGGVSAIAAASGAAGSSPDVPVVPPDQLNDIDLALAQAQPALTLANATLDTPHEAASSNTSSNPWDHASLIGRIFIAFGGLLTLGSALRMMIA